MARLTAKQSAITAQFLRDMSEQLSQNSCNDFYMENTPENLAFVREMIAAGDEPDEEPQITRDGTQIFLIDCRVADYLADLMEDE